MTPKIERERLDETEEVALRQEFFINLQQSLEDLSMSDGDKYLLNIIPCASKRR